MPSAFIWDSFSRFHSFIHFSFTLPRFLILCMMGIFESQSSFQLLQTEGCAGIAKPGFPVKSWRISLITIETVSQWTTCICVCVHPQYSYTPSLSSLLANYKTSCSKWKHLWLQLKRQGNGSGTFLCALPQHIYYSTCLRGEFDCVGEDNVVYLQI